MQKKMPSLESQLKWSQLPGDFSQKLQHFVAGYNNQNKGDINIEVAPTQADPCLAQLAVNGDIHFIILGDSDFAMYIGPNGVD